MILIYWLHFCFDNYDFYNYYTLYDCIHIDHQTLITTLHTFQTVDFRSYLLVFISFEFPDACDKVNNIN